MKEYWGSEPETMTPEQIVEWLEGYRQMMFEIWSKNPQLRLEWEKLQKDKANSMVIDDAKTFT